MTSAREEYLKTVSYIKYDLNKAQTELACTQQTVKYYQAMTPQQKQVNARGMTLILKDLKRIHHAINQYEQELYTLWHDDKVLSQADVEAVKPATEAELLADEIQDLKEAKREAKKYNSNEIWNKVRELDMAREKTELDMLMFG